ncbi:MAG TPA: hypothetical protein ENN40_00465, partial [Candidatus Aminicenantes bacterium]|nr:hypothetical protein [Candidatus Aminicenantes bacterium]
PRRVSRLVTPILWLFVVLPLVGTESPIFRLEEVLRAGHFARLPQVFADSSYAVLTDYFREARDLRLVEEAADQATAYVKFPLHAEIVHLAFQADQGRFSRLELTRMLYPLEYIRGFSAVDSRGVEIVRGDARLRLHAGAALVARPFGRLLLFSGRGDFHVTPADAEERLTLRRLRGGSEMTADFDSLVWLSDSRLTLHMIESDAVSTESETPAAAHQPLLERFNRQFGIFVPGFNEYWYPRFSDSLSLMMFKEAGGAFFHFQHNPSFVPDTTMVELPAWRYLLSYNREAGIKISLNAQDYLDKLDLELILDPASRRVQGTSHLRFKRDTGFMRFVLNPQMTVHAALSKTAPKVEVFSPGGVVRYLRGERMRDVMIRYSGKIEPAEGDNVPRWDERFSDPRRDWDPFILWNRDTRFYPGLETHRFQEMDVRISLPARYRCLVSGQLESETVAAGQRMLRFKSPAVKGLGLVCGDFMPRMRVEAAVAVEVYAARDLVMQRKLEISDIQPAVDFLVEAYGLPTSRVINLVLRRWHEYGGISNQGLVVLNVPGPRESRKETLRRRIMGNRPVIITDLYRDSLVHELAHQWWGGEVSWNSYRDIWITEGLAQFSTLFFHKKHLSDRAYAAAVRDMKRWVVRHSHVGPPVYGPRIRNLGDDVEAVQSVVYNRSALAFAMLTEILGEKEVFRRLRAILENRRYHSLTSSQFIAAFSEGSPRLKQFFAAWIYSRRLPRLDVATRFSGNEVKVKLTQDADFVIPLQVKVSTKDGISLYPVVMETEQLRLNWREVSKVRKVEVRAMYAPLVFD